MTVAAAVAAIGFAACSKSPEPQRRSMNFKIDNELLGLSFRADDFSMYAPKGWKHSSFGDLALENKYLSEGVQDERMAPMVVAMYHDEDSLGTLTVCQYNKELSISEQRKIVTNEANALRRHANPGELEEAYFTYAGYDIDNLVLAGAEQVITKLFARRTDRPMYCIEFVVPRMEFASLFPAIESSIGSIGIPYSPAVKQSKKVAGEEPVE